MAALIGGITLSLLSPNVSEPMADKPRMATKGLLRQGVIVWIVFALVFYWIIQDQPQWIHLLLAIGCGFLMAVVWTGIDAYGNHFRSKDSGDDDLK